MALNALLIFSIKIRKKEDEEKKLHPHHHYAAGFRWQGFLDTVGTGAPPVWVPAWGGTLPVPDAEGSTEKPLPLPGFPVGRVELPLPPLAPPLGWPG
ncbi:hypothetical protein M406DRAFT_319998 [Cryphonectria parasitica EP155]|uniref:Uncharacterized protein n=1 Tax=Cryphonectria parasitica (strain ATCC 38755 / EP155) TaxID=660469 RepID=A0A9P4YAU5_CRYP1|nr:uncharacterized protein M406DRAFT_319998 [Cryphonectria parasitica EP155]KAF3769619.1 hypothetical protein M406DRAFT_319998 [Cryphonectria parasitica EP155]